MTATLLGLPLEEAVRRLREAGVEPRVQYASAPHVREGGTLRVIRVRGEELTAARFEDDAREESEQVVLFPAAVFALLEERGIVCRPCICQDFGLRDGCHEAIGIVRELAVGGEPERALHGATLGLHGALYLPQHHLAAVGGNLAGNGTLSDQCPQELGICLLVGSLIANAVQHFQGSGGKVFLRGFVKLRPKRIERLCLCGERQQGENDSKEHLQLLFLHIYISR